MNRRPFLILASVAVAIGWPVAGQATDIYTWVDANGVVNYSTVRPADSRTEVFRTDPAFKSPAGASRADSGEEARALRSRVERLENQLDLERRDRIDDLKSQLENERDRVRQLESERAQPLPADYGAWWGPSVYPGPVLLVPSLPGKHPPDKPRKHVDKRKATLSPPADVRAYPPLSGPSAVITR
ncbi:MAG TPA: DUF4124 domain-containing protein [Rhodocyclaceae bacterium]|nr:DUF4124 domain-containing protein [Rhodocyclaceae bacterium]